MKAKIKSKDGRNLIKDRGEGLDQEREGRIYHPPKSDTRSGQTKCGIYLNPVIVVL